MEDPVAGDAARPGSGGDDPKTGADTFAVTPPTISLPKGGGAVGGIGEKFAANPVTGTGSMTVPIATSPGRSGFGPQFSLSYDSGAGQGIFFSAAHVQGITGGVEGSGWIGTPIPAPGAVVLAMLGLPLVGWIKRRFA